MRFLLLQLNRVFSDYLDTHRGFTASLNDCLLYVGIEKLVLPLLPSLAKRYVAMSVLAFVA